VAGLFESTKSAIWVPESHSEEFEEHYHTAKIEAVTNCQNCTAYVPVSEVFES
jgi:hypothetical protein